MRMVGSILPEVLYCVNMFWLNFSRNAGFFIRVSQPILDLQCILAGRGSVAGRVLSIANGVARVATVGGVVEVPLDGGGGERVSVQDGRAMRVQNVVDMLTFIV